MASCFANPRLGYVVSDSSTFYGRPDRPEQHHHLLVVASLLTAIDHYPFSPNSHFLPLSPYYTK